MEQIWNVRVLQCVHAYSEYNNNARFLQYVYSKDQLQAAYEDVSS